MILDWIRRVISIKSDDMQENDRTTNHDSHKSIARTSPPELADHWLEEGNISWPTSIPPPRHMTKGMRGR